LRGGAWGYNPAFVRCAARIVNNPGYLWFGDLGFRLVVGQSRF
jgi:formylglycine-generating enzyme required for sulfatase activity